MQGLRATINEYHQSCLGINNRIRELERQICLCDNQAGRQALLSRKNMLWFSLWDMYHAIYSLEEYIECAKPVEHTHRSLKNR